VRLPKFITFTGADDQTDLADLYTLARDYRFRVEFAVLLSEKRAGSPRYPSAEWLGQFKCWDLGRKAAHLCGAASRQLIEQGSTPFDREVLNGFARIQVNTTDPAVDPHRICSWADDLSRSYGYIVEPILQCRGPFPDNHLLSWLFDQSAGQGIQPDFWPPAPANWNGSLFANRLRGYAGGIGPGNVAGVLEKLSAGGEFWIDMESSLRNEHDRFDLARCRQVCEEVFGPPASQRAA
jgi:hypothetical protein